ncbi:carbon storage regulator [Marinobacterium iners]
MDHDIRVTPTEQRGCNIHVTIEAPKDVDIIREELGNVWPIEGESEV